MVLTIVSLLFLMVYSAIILYYHRHWKATPEFNRKGSTGDLFLSIIIPARNEEMNIGLLLQALEQQRLSRDCFEIIVVDDHSSDQTSDAARKYVGNNIRLIRSDFPENLSSKKKAIESGIRYSKGNFIVTTDADCIPGPDWLQTVYDFQLTTGADFIAGPVKLVHNSSLLQVFQSIDFLTLQGITCAGIQSGLHGMCNGANLAYRKSAFYKVNGFEGIDKVATGDDMLLMHKIQKLKGGKVHYLKSKGAIVPSQPMLTWFGFFNQRKRWASKTFLYDNWKLTSILLFVFMLNCLFPAQIIFAIFYPGYWWLPLAYCILKAGIEYPFAARVARFFGEGKIMRWFFFLQPLHILYTVITGLLSQFGGYEWKGRRTK